MNDDFMNDGNDGWMKGKRKAKGATGVRQSQSLLCPVS